MKLLVVDDEKEILILIKKALSGQYQVDTAHFPNEKLPEDLSCYSLILMDVMMPNENGYEIVEKIRNQVDCPIIFLSAKSLEDDIIYGLAIGADDYICKPFSVAELRARVAAHIRRDNRGAVSNIIRRGDVSVNITEKRISVKEKDIKLTKSEYEIVELLIKNIGQIYSKSQLYEYLYGYEKEGNDSAITEHIKNIRRKFQDEGMDPIETVWGIGYRWKKRCDGISKIIIKYIIIVFTLVVTTLGLLAVISLFIISKNDIKPANYVEQKVDAWIETCKQNGRIDIESFPEDADYVWKANDGKIIGNSVNGGNNYGLNKFVERYEKYQIGQDIKGHNVYMTITDADSVLFIHYIIGFKYEYLIVIIMALILMLDVVIPTILLIKRIKKAILQVGEYALAIGNNNLSVGIEKTNIKELNNVIAAVDEMKEGLVANLNEHWKEQQEQKRQMAQIAHDLKTPLTIIRGNADLLLEDESDAEKIESVEAIISNAERIARSILEILEKDK